MTIYFFYSIIIYLIIGIILFFFQRSFTFNKCGAPKSPKDYNLPEIEEIFINTPDKLKTIFL